jgi:hypothetical protein
MLLLLLDSILLVFISFSLGSIVKHLLSLWFKTRLQATFIEGFLLGLMISAVYFNAISFLVPVNYLVLIPPVLISAGWQYRVREFTVARFKNFTSRYLSATTDKILFTLLAGLIIFFSLAPPFNVDSPDYHYQSTYWSETQKIIPGLGNVHGRLAFNAASFILSAPYSFSHLFGQSVYPLNGTLIFLFYLWLFRNILQRKNNWSGVIYMIVAFLFMRPLLANAPSPASEPLVTITVAVVFLRLIEIIQKKQYAGPSVLIVPICISLFAVSAKLTSLPVLFVPGICVLFFLRKQPFAFYFKLFLIGCFIMVPWLARNVVLSGYLVYPLYQVDIFNVDWKVPRDVAYIDYALGTYGVKGEIDTGGAILRTNFGWMLPWLKSHFQLKNVFDFIILLLSFSSPVIWMIVRKKYKVDRQAFLLWLCAFAGVITWLLKAPEYRFGMSFLLMSFAIPMLSLCENYPLTARVFYRIAMIVFPIVFAYYIVTPTLKHPRLHTHGIGTLWLRPFRDKNYYTPTDMTTFRYAELGNGVRLYYADKYHHCYHIKDHPCMPWYYGIIEMRGNTITDGFRSVSNETRRTFPWLFIDKDEP